jgi:hypothetical protein
MTENISGLKAEEGFRTGRNDKKKNPSRWAVLLFCFLKIVTELPVRPLAICNLMGYN